MSEPLRPPGPGLAAHNRRVLAERLGWPAGAVEVCERVDAAHPGWHTNWSSGEPSRTRPRRGFYAQPYAAKRGDPKLLYGADEAELHAAIQANPLAPSWPR